jgi:predicted O-methyltransferase YrrM
MLKKLIKAILPGKIKDKLYDLNVLRKFNSLPKASCDPHNLIQYSDINLKEIFHSKELTALWEKSKDELASFKIPEGTGGINMGDRRAIFYLISFFKPKQVLEVGTHLGASTSYIGKALLNSYSNEDISFISVDLINVNDKNEKRWLKFSSIYSPEEILNKIGCKIKFEIESSISYLKKTNHKFDFIFLDGSHDASTVYQEIPLALKLLNPKGLILLHDFFPDGKPLWENQKVIQGPFLAFDRLKNEGTKFKILPLGELPWTTKLNSSLTSLAILAKE